MERGKVYLITIVLWLACVSIYAWIYVVSMMNYLTINPSPDLYANNAGFQFIAFVLTRGFPSLIVLTAILIVEHFILKKRDSEKEREGNNRGRC